MTQTESPRPGKVKIEKTPSKYNSQIFNTAFSDVPDKKNDLVEGRYELPAPAVPTTVAVKIIDMLGEEVLVVQEVLQ